MNEITPMNPASLIGKKFQLATVAPTKGGNLYAIFDYIEFLPNGETRNNEGQKIYKWVPYGNGGIAITNFQEKPIMVFSSYRDDVPLGLRISTAEAVALLGEQKWQFSHENPTPIRTPNEREQALVNASLEIEQRMKHGILTPPEMGSQIIYPRTSLHNRQKFPFRVTVSLPHYESIESLIVAIELWRNQTEPPYIMVIDTGSSMETRKKLEEMRAGDVEIHFLASKTFNNGSAPVTAALDMAQTICLTPYILHTHTDVFPMRDDLVEALLIGCNEKCPVIGYRMSPRDGSDGKLPKRPDALEASEMVGHALLMLHMPTIHIAGATWSMQRMKAQFGYEYEISWGWPDTETGFNKCLENAKIKPFFLGTDVNFMRQKDHNIDHPRSYTGSMISNSPMFEQCQRWMADALEEARHRIALTRAKRQERLHPNRSSRNQSTPAQSLGETSAPPDTCLVASPRGLHHQVSETEDRGDEPSRPYKQTHPRGLD